MIRYVYSLTNPNSNEVFYIGSTTNLKARLSHHLLYSNNISSYATRYKIIPIIEVIEEVLCDDKKDVIYIENYWIEQFRQWGFNLINYINNISVRKNKIIKMGSSTTVLRFNSEKQRKGLKKIAKQNGRSMNAEINIAIDKHLSSYETFPIYSHPEIQKQSNKK